MSNYATIKLRRGTQYYVDQYTPTVGEVVWSNDNTKLYIGDGYTRGGRSWLEGDPRGTQASYRMYGIDRYGTKGFHSLPSGVFISTNNVRIGGSASIGNYWGYMEIISMAPGVDSDIYVEVKIPEMWDRSKDVIIQVLYGLAGGTAGQKVKLDGSYWVASHGTSISAGSPTGTGTDYIRCDTHENLEVIDEINLHNFKIANTDISSTSKSIFIKLTREGTNVLDTYLGTLGIIRLFFYQVSNANDYGYYFGGCDPENASGVTSTIDRFIFPFNDGNSSVVGNLTAAKQGMSACNSSINGYVSGGTNSDESADYSTVDRIAFPFNSGTGSASTILDYNKRYVAGCNCSLHGYVIGGVRSTNTVYHNIVKQWFQFENYTYTTSVGNLSGSIARYGSTGVNSSLHGYIMGGTNGVNATTHISTIDKFSFSHQNGVSTNVANFSGTDYASRLLNMTNEEGNDVGAYSAAGFNSSTYGYISGGYQLSSISRMEYASDNGGTELRSNLSVRKWGTCGNNSSRHGYTLGGAYYGTSYTSYIERLNFSFDSLDATTVGNLSSTRHTRGAAIDGVDFCTQLI